MTKFKTAPNMIKMDMAEKMTTHIGKDYLVHMDTRKYKIIAKPLANQIN